MEQNPGEPDQPKSRSVHDMASDRANDNGESSEHATAEPRVAHATGDLERDTRVYGRAGRYSAFVSPAWEIWGPNGGYMASLALRAAIAESHIKRPASIYCQFLRPARFDWLDAEVTVVQRGRRSESIRVSLTQEGKPVLEGLVRTAFPADGLEHQMDGPKVRAPEGLPCVEDLLDASAPRFAFWKNIESGVLDPARFDKGPKPSEPRWLEWYRFRPKAIYDDPLVDAMRTLILVDTLGWPAAWLAHPSTTIRGPNLDLAAFFHASAQDSEWLLCEQESPIAHDGLAGARARIFGRDGRLLASGGAQLLCIPGP
jgi:acyl-CoA thioesterase-2